MIPAYHILAQRKKHKRGLSLHQMKDMIVFVCSAGRQLWVSSHGVTVRNPTLESSLCVTCPGTGVCSLEAANTLFPWMSSDNTAGIRC